MMDKLQESSIDEVVPFSVGRALREGRERMGWSVEDVVNLIKLAPRQIVAIEADDFESLPETAFVRGFVRSYAKVLQLDAEPLLANLPGAKAAKVDALKVNAPFPTAQSARRQNLNMLIAAFVMALLIAAFAIWQARSPRVVTDGALVAQTVALPAQAEEEVASSGVPGSGVAASGIAASGVAVSVVAGADVASSGVVSTRVISTGVINYGVSTEAVSAVPAVRAVSAVRAASAVNAGGVVNGAVNAGGAVSRLKLVFDKESWTEIKDQSGRILSRQLNLPGSELDVEGVAPFSLVIGHASSVHLTRQGKPVDLTTGIDASNDVARMTLP